MQFLNENAEQYHNTDMMVWLLTAMPGLLAPKIHSTEPVFSTAVYTRDEPPSTDENVKKIYWRQHQFRSFFYRAR